MMSGIISGVLTISALLLGLAGGPMIALSLGGRFSGFDTGVWLGIPLWIAGSVLIGHLGGAFGEEALGTRVGVPFGVLIGALIGSLAASVVSGFIGSLIAMWITDR